MTWEPGLEKATHGLFMRRHVAYRKAMIPKATTKLSNLELPTNSVVHFATNIGNENVLSIEPDVTIPYIRNERHPVYLQQIYELPTDGPFAFTDKIQYRPNAYTSKHLAFFRNTSSVRRALNLDTVLNRQAALILLDYNTILTAKAPGRYTTYIKFKAVFQTMLHQISLIGDKRHQFIHMPLTDTIYSRVDFFRAFDKIDATSLKHPTDMSYFFTLHLLGLLARGLNPDEENSVSTSLFANLDMETLRHLNLILSYEDTAVVYNLGDLLDMAVTDSFYMRVLRHINIVTLLGQGEDIDSLKTLSDDEFFDRIEKPSDNTASTPEETSNTSTKDPQETTPIKTSPEKVTQEPVSYTAYLDDKFQEKVIENNDLTTKQKERAKVLKNKADGILLDGTSLSELVRQKDPDIHENDLEFLKDKVPDPSMTKSSVMDFDEIYINKVMKKDIASVLLSMEEHGLYITDLQVEDEVTALDGIRKYRAVYNDIDGKKHTVQFSMPIVRPDGTFLINGVINRMTKQQTNLPIVKISQTRVNLSSNYNKAIVEKKMSQVSRIDVYYSRALQTLQKKGYADITYGKINVTPETPYDYAEIGSKYQHIILKTDIGTYIFHFDVDRRHDGTYTHLTKDVLSVMPSLEEKYGIYCGRGPDNSYMFYGMDNVITHIAPDQVTEKSPDPQDQEVFIEVLHHVKDPEVSLPKIHPEWVEIKVQDRTFPVIFLLGYRHGISNALKKIASNATFYPSDEKMPRLKHTDIKISFLDGDLVVPRYPLKTSLIIAGLRRFNTKKYAFYDLDLEDAYFNMLLDLNFSTNYLKGISSFFDFFVDPITRNVLISMNEPTTVDGLLYRASEMLSDPYADEASSMKNHRMRSYERFSSFLYNEMSRSAASYKTRGSQKKTFSINQQAIFLKIIQDATVSPIEIINPIQSMKGTMGLTYTGSVGGRTAQSFVVNDRKYPKDGIGILSETTPDSGKVSISTYTSTNPSLNSIRGTYDTTTDPESLSATQILSVPSLLMPGSTQDDSKRANFISIQLTHHVPCEQGDVSRIRTGYEQVIAHRTSEEFAYSAKRDGVIKSVDTKTNQVTVAYDDARVTPDAELSLPDIKSQDLKTHIASKTPIYILRGESEADPFVQDRILHINKTGFVRVKESVLFTNISDIPNATKTTSAAHINKLKKESRIYYISLQPISPTVPGDVDVFTFGNQYTNVSGSYLEQPIRLTIQTGDRVKRGDILAYNSGFFRLDPEGRAVSWKHGVMASVAMVDTAVTYEDSCAISKTLGERLQMNPAHVRTLTLKKDTVLHDIVSIGTHVETTDLLATLEDGDLDTLSASDDPDTVSFLADLNKKAPRAKYAGEIVDIRMYYGSDRSELHPSLAKLAKKLDDILMKKAQTAKGTLKENVTPWPQKIPVGTKYQGIDFDETTVLIEITIRDTLACGAGDKLVLGNQAKTVVGDVIEREISTKSGRQIDMLFSTSSISNRIILSPLISGVGERCLETLEKDAIALYFGSTS